MGIKSRIKTHTHKYADGSEWVFRAERQDTDEETIQNMTVRTVTGKLKPKDVRKARRDGTIEELVMNSIEQETVMSVRRATLFVMTVSWSGPEFVVPEDFVKGEEFGAPEKDPSSGKYVPHPLIGQVCPVTPEWIGARDPIELEEVFEAMEDVWAGRSSEEEDAFPRSGQRVDGPTSGRKPAGEVPVPAAAD